MGKERIFFFRANATKIQQNEERIDAPTSLEACGDEATLALAPLEDVERKKDNLSKVFGWDF